jgi:septal ring factor EnvC (AmiA/AmiB activator)
MKRKLRYTLKAVTLIAGVVLIGCNSSTQKKGNTEDVTIVATEDYLADLEKYREEATTKTNAHQKSLAVFNSRIAEDKEEATEEYKEEIAKLDKKNSDLRKKMDDYKSDGKEKWESFKSEFNYDMDELSTAIKDLANNNVL